MGGKYNNYNKKRIFFLLLVFFFLCGGGEGGGGGGGQMPPPVPPSSAAYVDHQNKSANYLATVVCWNLLHYVYTFPQICFQFTTPQCRLVTNLH